MPLSPEDLALVRASFAQVRRRMEPGSTLFYDVLFARAPGYRTLFRDDLSGQGMKFMTTLGTILGTLDRPDDWRDRHADLAEGHAALGIGPEHHAVMREALIDTFRATMGDALDGRTEAAWRRAYDEIAGRMLATGLE